MADRDDSPTTRQLGGRWEEAAESFLHQRGLKTRKRNFYSRFGEIDLVMKDGEVLVFVEVRFRGNDNFGDGATTVTTRKQARLIRAALYFLSLNPGYAQKPCRFDVISISIRHGESEFHWIRNAFETQAG